MARKTLKLGSVATKLNPTIETPSKITHPHRKGGVVKKRRLS